MRIVFLTLTILFLCSTGFTQSSKVIDSLTAILHDSSQDTSRVKILVQLCHEYKLADSSMALDYAYKALELSEKLHYQEGLGYARFSLADVYFSMYLNDKSLKNWEESLHIWEELNDLQQIAITCEKLGRLHWYTGSSERALSYYLRALDLYTINKDRNNMASILVSIGNCYKDMSEYDNSLDSYRKGLLIHQELQDSVGIGIANNNMGLAYWKMGDLATALEQFHKGISIREAIKDTQGVASSLTNIGIIYFYQGDLVQSINYWRKALDMWIKLNNKTGMHETYNNIGAVYSEMEKYKEALKYFEKSLAIKEELGNKPGVGMAYENIGSIYQNINQFDKAREFYNKSLHVFMEIDNKSGITSAYTSLAGIDISSNNGQSALALLKKAYLICKETGELHQLHAIYSMMSKAYQLKGDTDNAFDYYKKYIEVKDSIYTIEKAEKIVELQTQYETLEKVKEIELLNADKVIQQKEIDLKNKETQKQKLIIYSFLGGLLIVIIFSFFLLRLFIHKRRANKILAIQNLSIKNQKEEITTQRDTLEKVNTHLEKLSIVASETANAITIYTKSGTILYRNPAFKKLYGDLIHELVLEIGQNIKELPKKYEVLKYFKECIDTGKVLLYTTEYNNKQNDKIWVQTTLTPIRNSSDEIIKLVSIDSDITTIKKAEEEIELQRDKLKDQKDQLELFYDLAVTRKNRVSKQKKEIEDSILYAKRIQSAVLPNARYIDSILSEYFVLFKPHSVVSGDFYWLTKTENWIVIVVADCTGHGVPGAFMSMLGVSFLNEIVRKKEVINAAKVLDHLRESVIEALQQTGIEGENKDGMDMAIVAINKNMTNALWAGANNPMYLIPSTHSAPRTSPLKGGGREEVGSTIIELRGDKMPVAVHDIMDSFTNHEITINKGDQLYLFTDGYPDQFGGAHGKKYLRKRFIELLMANSSRPMQEQKEMLEKTLESWMFYEGKRYDQVDDITVLGVKI